ncbi:hypothetical protein COW36_14205 [bacterium (Candidatus Blackallbacteria) CG17_big_fil_post_rev_8_21_14_2_50_48_46]|uniref:Hemerythrin-like domain-containing protein n=1 Tax=bacterium (Candidatus Blackallbacteria) CG17_big_fil_post_rev_8_21_14_2_50_48_46 TaxID=2014261 RepID=A0A2M7G361_9BACT|nr:MAG: hypothetical protein COW64_23675 [bacterium (Candidatus Blackallbacteria) CG18_big_fil_WC_8_21_14_2_50_49_26]PIW16272.1 MAG: hypothetical protein COW36_14205 [bacterium (Candidatus Blackallbacteria) CG17_big_fil_post_rev_8_21_14_2_50_48_46]PIW49847.1 MAG: hypothetical protein COW20_04100 [bacterium (Candidatus Blackallbacteria) CG13_big_fil_rev_8_21_14_2_50_49_14]
MAIIWTQDLNTGIDIIDKQHVQIVDYINQLDGERDRKAIGSILENLIDYTLSHFSFEESLAEDAGYKLLNPHKKVHEMFIQKVNEYKHRFDSGEEVADEIEKLLTSWLVNHIKRDDADYAPTVKAHLSGQNKGGWLARSLKKFFG